MSDWHDRDEWWEATAVYLFRRHMWEYAPQQVEQVLALAALEPPVRVLDLPCGVGRHSLEFARLGCAVTGVDRTVAYLEEAQARAGELGLAVEFVRADMREFERPGAFDLAINLFTSFGYFEDAGDDRRVLDNFYTSLRPGGVLVMDMSGKEVLARVFMPRDWSELEDGTLFLEERRVSEGWTKLENRWIIIRGGERHEYPFSLRLYGASDLRGVLEQAGFEPVRIYGDLLGSPYDHTAQRLVAVARKPEG
jgi:SAM-dependent methyltransferase